MEYRIREVVQDGKSLFYPEYKACGMWLGLRTFGRWEDGEGMLVYYKDTLSEAKAVIDSELKESPKPQEIIHEYNPVGEKV